MGDTMRGMWTYDVILFDLDDTLVVEEPAAVEAFIATGALATARHGVDAVALTRAVRRVARPHWFASPSYAWLKTVGMSSWEALWSDFSDDHPEVAAMRAWAPGYRRVAWREGLRACGVEDDALADEMAERFIIERDARHRPYPDVPPTLAALARTHRLGVVTNGIACHQYRKARGAGLTEPFEVFAVSSMYGIGKPHPAVFRGALDALGVTPEQTLVVGDSLERDVAGAQAAGMAAVWLHREGREADAAVTPMATVRDLGGLVALVGA